MKLNTATTDVPRTIRRCPQCGGNRYEIEMAVERDEANCVGISCKACGFDILQAYQSMTRDRD